MVNFNSTEYCQFPLHIITGLKGLSSPKNDIYFSHLLSLMWLQMCMTFFSWNTKDILKNVGVQTTLNPIEFYCMVLKLNSLRHWKYHVLNTNNIAPHWISLYGHKNTLKHSKCLLMCSTEEWKSDRFGTTHEWVHFWTFCLFKTLVQLIWCVCEGNLYSLFNDCTKFPHIRNKLNVYPDYDS